MFRKFAWFLIGGLVLGLTACPQFNLPPNKTPLAQRVEAEGLSIGSGTYFSTGDLLVAQSLSGNILSFDPNTGRITPFATPIPEHTDPVVEFRKDELELYLWPIHHSFDPPPTEPLYVAVLDARTGNHLRNVTLTAPTELLDAWNPASVARKGDRIYIGALRGQIAQLQETEEGISLAATLTIEEVFEISGNAEDPYEFVVSKIVPDPASDDLFVLVQSDLGFSGMHHVFRIAPDGTTRWSAARYINPKDIVLDGERLLYFKPTGAVALDATSGVEQQQLDISIGECYVSRFGLKPVKYDREEGLIYAPHGVLETQPGYHWRWVVTDRLNLPVTVCDWQPAVLDGVAYFGGNRALLAVDIESGEPLSLARSNHMSEVRLGSPAFAVGGYVVVPQQEGYRMFFTVYRPVQE